MQNKLVTPVIEVKNLSYTYDKELVLDNINLVVNKHDFLALIGPNGGGKSTLMKLIVGLYTPNKGTVTFVENASKIGYVPQNTNINVNFPIKVFEVVLMGCKKSKKGLFGYNKEEIIHAEKLLEEVGMKEFAHTKIGSLSGGQRQRVMIARALCSNPDILLLDEPTSSIDKKGQTQVFELLKELNKKITIIVVNHEITVVFKYATKVAHINKNLTYHDLSSLQKELEINPDKHMCEVELLQMLAKK